MIILGINGVDGIFHDASASLLVDGAIVASVEEERFNRKKHTNGLPVQAIEYCLKKAGAAFSDIDRIGYYLQPEILRKTCLTDIVSRFHVDPSRLAYVEQAAASIEGVEARLRQRFAFGPETKFHFLNHHVAHAASAYYVSDFDSAAVLTIDGSGERESSVLFRGCGKSLQKVHDFLVYPDSLGYLYNVFAAHLGLSWISGPGKLMGLAAYGCPDTHRLADIVKLNDDPSRPIEIDLAFFDYYLGGPGLSAAGMERFGAPLAAGATLTQWHFDLAAAVQNALEQAVLHLARQIHHYLPQERNLCLSGGVALNVTSNRRIRDLGGFDGFFVSPPAYDGGTSLGCALFLDAGFAGRWKRFFDPYLGPNIENDFDIESALRGFAGYIEWQRLAESDLIEQAADCLTQGRFIGWVQGRMECGPRALGNRSILANPTGAATKDRLNAGIKKREAFRPYAPSVLQEECSNWFDLEDSPYMLLEAMVHPDRRERIPAVVHVDGSSRPQTVTAAQNPRYYKLIRRFFERTGIPLVLNTSFNQHGEPVVNRPEEAVIVLLATELDDLFLGDYHVRRNPANSRSLEYVSVGGLGVWKQDEIPGLFDLSEIGGALPHVSTLPDQWSYAAAVPLHPASSHLAGIGHKLLLRIQLSVEMGRIGLLFVEDDLRTVLGEPVEQAPSLQASWIDILLDPAPASGWLVIRNCAPGGNPSACTISGIRGFSASHGLPDWR